MADSATAPSGSGGKPSTQDEATRGRPHYEKLRRDLKTAIERKRALDNDLAAIEQDISRTEDEYLESTAAAGNLVRGFDNYMKASAGAGGAAGASAAGPGTATRRKGGISDADRIFSNSSVGWAPPDDAPGKAKDDGGGNGKGSGRDTPSGAGKPAAKKGKKAEPEEEERPYKRGKVSWGRE